MIPWPNASVKHSSAPPPICEHKSRPAFVLTDPWGVPLGRHYQGGAGMIGDMNRPLPVDGRRIAVLSWVGTAMFAIAALAAVLSVALRIVVVVVALALFAAGIVAFLAAYARAVDRSRTEEIGVGGLYFLAGSAPGDVRWHLLGSTVVQMVLAIGAASARPFTAVAFGILVPMYGLGMAGLWASRYGTFPDRQDLRPKKQRTR